MITNSVVNWLFLIMNIFRAIHRIEQEVDSIGFIVSHTHANQSSYIP